MEHSSPTGAVRFDEQGLVPCVTQDWRTGEVLTLAYMNGEALERTRATGEVHFYSRSRDEIWHKGQTSGNVQRVRQIRYDCDADALVALVDPAGPACHTGQRSCFYRDLEGSADPARDAPPADGEPTPAAYEALATLERTLLDRRERPSRRLLHGRAAGRPAADSRQGARGGGRGVPRRRLGVR